MKLALKVRENTSNLRELGQSSAGAPNGHRRIHIKVANGASSGLGCDCSASHKGLAVSSVEDAGDGVAAIVRSLTSLQIQMHLFARPLVNRRVTQT